MDFPCLATDQLVLLCLLEKVEFHVSDFDGCLVGIQGNVLCFHYDVVISAVVVGVGGCCFFLVDR